MHKNHADISKSVYQLLSNHLHIDLYQLPFVLYVRSLSIYLVMFLQSIDNLLDHVSPPSIFFLRNQVHLDGMLRQTFQHPRHSSQGSPTTPFLEFVLNTNPTNPTNYFLRLKITTVSECGVLNIGNKQKQIIGTAINNRPF